MLSFLLLLSIRGVSQPTVDSLLQAGNQFYIDQDYDRAGFLWSQAAKLAEYKVQGRLYFYYAAYSYAKAKDSINSFICMEHAVFQFGFNDKQSLVSDDVFDFLERSHRWSKIVDSIEPAYTTEPSKVKIIDSDVRNFWDAYDMVQINPEKANEIYKQEYFDKGSIGLEFYFIHKIVSIDHFVYVQNIKQKYYKSIRSNTLKVSGLSQEFENIFVEFKNIYPQAIFPPIYFVIGKLNSAGTASSDGLILGIDQACMDPSVDTTELNHWEKNNISTLEDLPYIVAHELIHFQQHEISDTTLLKAAIDEGMADFLGELISGKTANDRLHIYARGKEKEIWQAFKHEMYLNRSYNWIANSDQETEDRPADLGYWVGYQICKSYYDQAKDKKQAINDILNIKDYKAFFKASKYDEKMQ